MKPNEIGHFPYMPPRNQFDKGGYERIYIDHVEDDGVVWATNWKILGEVTTINIPEHFQSEILIDLQTASDCYCADLLTIDEKQYIFLYGSGWMECGFPFSSTSFDPDDPFETKGSAKGGYALLKGKAVDKFIELAKKDYLPNFDDCSTGNFQDDFILAVK